MFDDKTDKGGPKDSDANKNQIYAPSIKLPKSDRTIRGIGEKFAANPVTGTSLMSMSIATSPDRSCFGHQLSLSYYSVSSNGPFGFDWGLSVQFISRKTQKGLPQYLDGRGHRLESDIFLLSGLEDLMSVLEKKGETWEINIIPPRMIDTTTYEIGQYRSSTEDGFASIECWTRTDALGDVHWRPIFKDNILALYRKDDSYFIFDPTDLRCVFNWHICESRDDKRNGVVYWLKEKNGISVDLAHTNECDRGLVYDLGRKANCYRKYSPNKPGLSC